MMYFDTVISSNSDYVDFLTKPSAWNEMSTEEKQYFSSSDSPFSSTLDAYGDCDGDYCCMDIFL